MIQHSEDLRDARVAVYKSIIGPSPKLEGFTGTQPSTTSAADTGTKLFSMTLPSDWTTAVSAGSITIAGTWTATGLAAGVAGYYRLKNNAGTVCHEQGSVTNPAGGGDMLLSNPSITLGGTVTITMFTKTESGV